MFLSNIQKLYLFFGLIFQLCLGFDINKTDNFINIISESNPTKFYISNK